MRYSAIQFLKGWKYLKKELDFLEDLPTRCSPDSIFNNPKARKEYERILKRDQSNLLFRAGSFCYWMTHPQRFIFSDAPETQIQIGKAYVERASQLERIARQRGLL